MKIHILTKGLRSYNGIAFLTPLILNQKRFLEIGVTIEFFTKISEKLTDCDILILESKFFVSWWQNSELLFNTLKKLKKKNKLYYFDLGDSSSSWCLGVLPFINKMYKSYLLKDKKRYTKPLYGGRIWTDYYHQKFNINDNNNNNVPLFYAKESDLDKINLGYSATFGNYTLNSVFWQGNLKTKLAKRLWFLRKLSVQKTKAEVFIKPSSKRKINLSARMSTNMYTETVAFQRLKIAKLLAKYNAPSTKLNRKEYMQELANSKIVASPFGWGEINYKDYETAITGGVLLKPDISHLQTWPNIFNDKTIVQYKWDFSDLESKVEDIITNYNDYLDYAVNLQNSYKNYVASKEGQDEFCQYFKDLM